MSAEQPHECGPKCSPTGHVAFCPNEPNPCPKCGKAADSFACKAKHQHLNSGAFKAYIR